MPISHRFFYSLLQDIRDKKILDIVAVMVFTRVRLAKKVELYRIDNSPNMIQLTERNAEFHKVRTG